MRFNHLYNVVLSESEEPLRLSSRSFAQGIKVKYSDTITKVIVEDKEIVDFSFL